jgi:FtsZ-interacting cell division protein ZipA
MSNISFIVIAVLAIALVIFLITSTISRRKKAQKADVEIKSKHAHPAGTLVPKSTIKATDIAQHSIVTTKPRHSSANSSSSIKANSYRERHNDNYYPSNAVTDTMLLSALLHTESEPTRTTYEPASTTMDVVSPSGYSSYESNGSSPSWSSSSDSSSSSSSDSSSSFSSFD